jgi:EEF1A N-terminal glycine/lysine methyltransferase
MLYNVVAEWNAEKKTLFATYIWHGARAIAEYILHNFKDSIMGSSVLELGAAAGLPSLLCHLMGADFVCASDYPTEHILQVLKDNIDRNKTARYGGSIASAGYLWGTDAAGILDMNRGRKYDFILASECLWRHEQVGGG